ncbi:hypothetical protein V6N13_110401 [Hibiscus sabdariffa]
MGGNSTVKDGYRNVTSPSTNVAKNRCGVWVMVGMMVHDRGSGSGGERGSGVVAEVALVLLWVWVWIVQVMRVKDGDDELEGGHFGWCWQ